MRFIRKTLILIHRYLGIVLSVLFFVWFVSGIAMIYARGMPSLTPEMRIERLPALDASRIQVAPLAAAMKHLPGPPDQTTLLTILNRPAYRFLSGAPSIVFADNAELLEVDAERAGQIARSFVNLPAEDVIADGVLTSVDQWTIGQARYLPLHRFKVDDAAKTELYVSEQIGEVVVMTTRASRALAWVAAIPHWFYFKSLRTKPVLWRQIILWTSGLATISTLIGLVLGILQYRRARPHIPYSGWLRWHYITGIVFGVLTLTWVFSGFLSVEPWYWASEGGLGPGMQESLDGGYPDLKQFPQPPPLDQSVKEVEFLTIQGNPYFALQTGGARPVLVAADTLEVRIEPFSTESLLERLRAANPDVTILESTLLEDYDSYYYSFERRAPLPVLRVKFNDPDSSWFYVDPHRSQIVARAHRLERVQRWIYRGFHSLDFSFWYYNRPLWDIGMIVLSLGGAALSFIGIVIAWKRVARAVSRLRKGQATTVSSRLE